MNEVDDKAATILANLRACLGILRICDSGDVDVDSEIRRACLLISSAASMIEDNIEFGKSKPHDHTKPSGSSIQGN